MQVTSTLLHARLEGLEGDRLTYSPGTFRTMSHEFAFIDRVRQRALGSSAATIGIGDDCAVLNSEANLSLLVGKDVLLEGTHFDLSQTTPELVGRKSLAVNLSDMAAMAGVPRFAFVGLALPRSRGSEFAERLMIGIQSLANEFGMCIAGGDTNIWDGPLVVSVTVTGEIAAGGAVLRRGAQPGDWICVTGALGGSLTSGRHLSFTPRVFEAQTLRSLVPIHAMIDLSDGLSSDLQHILQESSVGAVIDAVSIPIHKDVPESLPHEERLRHAMSDGEDFELLFTVSAEDGAHLLQASPLSCGITKIGEILPEPGASLRSQDGTLLPLVAAGYEHRF